MDSFSINYRVFEYFTSNKFRFIFVMSALIIFSNIMVFHVFGSLFGAAMPQNGILCDAKLGEQLIIGVIIGPALETIIFHFLLIEFLLFAFKNFMYKIYLAILVSALIFAVTHNLLLNYLINAFIGGVVLSSAYIIAKTNKMIPVVIVFAIHSTVNLMIKVINNFP